MKLCPKCGELKPLAAFYRQAGRGDGLQTYCKCCDNVRTLLRAAAHPERGRARSARYNKRHPEKQQARDALRYASDPERERARAREWTKNNPAKSNVKVWRRRAKKLQATPTWANEFFIAEAYDLAARRTKALGFKWQVDHIVPLKSKIVCGLHVETNLRVIPATQNLSKGNRYWPGMPGAT